MDKRLPENPLVLKPVEKTGKYGGTWRTALKGGQDDAWLTRTIGYDYLVRWDPEWKTIVPNVAESWTVNPGSHGVHLQAAQGHEVVRRQAVHRRRHRLLGQRCHEQQGADPAVGGFLAAGGKYGTAEKIDENTVKFKFAAPNGLFLVRNATPDGQGPVQFQAEYCKQFHKSLRGSRPSWRR